MVVRRPSFTTATCIQRPTGRAWLHEVGSASRSAGYTTYCRKRSGDRLRLQVGSAVTSRCACRRRRCGPPSSGCPSRRGRRRTGPGVSGTPRWCSRRERHAVERRRSGRCAGSRRGPGPCRRRSAGWRGRAGRGGARWIPSGCPVRCSPAAVPSGRCPSRSGPAPWRRRRPTGPRRRSASRPPCAGRRPPRPAAAAGSAGGSKPANRVREVDRQAEPVDRPVSSRVSASSGVRAAGRVARNHGANVSTSMVSRARSNV